MTQACFHEIHPKLFHNYCILPQVCLHQWIVTASCLVYHIVYIVYSVYICWLLFVIIRPAFFNYKITIGLVPWSKLFSTDVLCLLQRRRCFRSPVLPLVFRVIVAMKRLPWIGSDLRVKGGQCRTTQGNTWRLIVNMPVKKKKDWQCQDNLRP